MMQKQSGLDLDLVQNTDRGVSDENDGMSYKGIMNDDPESYNVDEFMDAQAKNTSQKQRKSRKQNKQGDEDTAQ